MSARILSVLFFIMLAPPALASNSISYQGQLQQQGQPFNGTANLDFRLFDAATSGNQIGPRQDRLGWPVSDGVFQVELDFGMGAFSGSPRFLEIRVNGTLLTPRQPVTATPVALFALDGNEGPTGPAGPIGPIGPEGPPGPSPTLYVLAGNNFQTTPLANLTLQGLGPEINQIMITVYLVDTGSNVIYPIPGKGISALSTYRVWWLRVSNDIAVRINRHEGTGETYGEIRVVTTPISTTGN